jgi:AcrR family transcriptional regulator
VLCDASLWWRCRVTGFAGTSIDEVAAATGLGKGSLYGAFGDKRQLYLRVFDRYCTEVPEATVRSLTGPDDGAYARLRQRPAHACDRESRPIRHCAARHATLTTNKSAFGR